MLTLMVSTLAGFPPEHLRELLSLTKRLRRSNRPAPLSLSTGESCPATMRKWKKKKKLFRRELPPRAVRLTKNSCSTVRCPHSTRLEEQDCLRGSTAGPVCGSERHVLRHRSLCCGLMSAGSKCDAEQEVTRQTDSIRNETELC